MKKSTGKGTIGKVAKKIFKTAGGYELVTDVFGKVAESTRPIIEKAMEHHQTKMNHRTDLPDVTQLPIDQGKEYLKELGFHVVVLLAKPKARYMTEEVGEIVAMQPKPGKVTKGSLVKLYYVTEEVIKASQETGDLVNVIGLDVQRAQQILQQKGLIAEPVRMKAHPRYVKERPNVVIDMVPKPNILLTSLKPGSLVKLRYVDEGVLQESSAMISSFRRRKIKRDGRQSQG